MCAFALSNLPSGAQRAPQPTSSSQSSELRPAVVQLVGVGPSGPGQNRECSATGFFVNEDGYIVTNAHVIEMAKECLSKTAGARIVAKLAQAPAAESVSPNGEAVNRSQGAGATAPSVSCDLIGADDEHDIAILRTERPVRWKEHGAPYEVLNAGEVVPGAPIQVTGHTALAWDAVTASGRVLGQRKLLLAGLSVSPVDMLILDIPLQPGASGSPVSLDPEGWVVGVVEGQDPQNSARTVAVPIRYAIDLLDHLEVKWHGPPEQLH